MMDIDIHPLHIFNSSGSTRRLIDVTYVNQWWQKEWISGFCKLIDGPHAQKLREQEELIRAGDFDALCASLKRPSNVVRGSYGHSILAAYSEAFLLDKGKQVLFEQWDNGHCVDVISADKEWFIECGDTKPDPILEHLLWSCKHFAVLPFQDGEVFPLPLFVFERGPAWDDKIIEHYVLWGPDPQSRIPRWSINL